MADLDKLARLLAEKGKAEVDRVEAIVGRARQMIDDPASHAAEDPPTPQYAWEAEAQYPVGTPFLIFKGSVVDFATGEGITISFMARLARDEGEFRRWMAVEFGPAMADSATVAEGSGARVPFGALFMSPPLKAKLEAIEGRDDQPAVFSFHARSHANYS